MPRNVEFKLKVTCLDQVRRRLAALSNQDPLEIKQEDIFFDVPGRRVKLRITSPGKAELISYRRPDTSGPRVSCYTRKPQADPTAAKSKLTKQFKIRGIVKKHRTVYLINNTRIHLDDVEGLGTFIELEVFLGERLTVQNGITIAKDMVNKLGIEGARPVAEAYIDLLEQNLK